LAVPKARHLTPNMTEVVGVHRSNGGSRLDTRIREDRSPGINHQGVSMTLTATVVDTGLSRSEDIGRVFNGPGLQKHLPMVFSGEGRECRRNHQ
jgi:hypothetical protein